MVQMPRKTLERRSSAKAESKVVSRLLYGDDDRARAVDLSGKEGDARSAFRRDWARLTHSTAFRRLQGKTQLFPSDENDFFRNRLTHSLEVAQIATGIALNLNSHGFFAADPIDVDVVNFAALAHDLGHPPFGHNGEKALDALMRDQGGFEGNAQTLRILSTLEKKETTEFPHRESVPVLFHEGEDLRRGLNVTMRSLAAILKYDQVIPPTRDNNKLVKGYYASDASLVREIKRRIAGDPLLMNFRTIECSIMDLADDIAYSTYDLEDAFKGGFLSPVSILAVPDYTKEEIVKDVNKKMNEDYASVAKSSDHLNVSEMNQILLDVFENIYTLHTEASQNLDTSAGAAISSTLVHSRSSALSEDGYLRAEFTSKLVNLMMSGIELVPNKAIPALSKVRFELPTFKMVEILKRVAFRTIIDSHRLKMAEYRGTAIIKHIFDALIEPEQGKKLLPADWRAVYESSPSRHRAVCDFIAGMTDRYCVEFYSRLVGINAPSIQKPY